jgi:pyruvate dehydrogenase (quinone)
MFVDREEKMGPAWDEALASDRPVLLEFKTDPEVPPLPPHITFDQMKKITTTVLKGDPEDSGMISGAARQVLSALWPGR